MTAMIWLENIRKTYRLGEVDVPVLKGIDLTIEEGELVNRPALVLADEPTGALDTQTSDEVMALLTELNSQGITVIIVTHEPDVAAQTQRIIHVQDGLLQKELSY